MNQLILWLNRFIQIILYVLLIEKKRDLFGDYEPYREAEGKEYQTGCCSKEVRESVRSHEEATATRSAGRHSSRVSQLCGTTTMLRKCRRCDDCDGSSRRKQVGGCGRSRVWTSACIRVNVRARIPVDRTTKILALYIIYTRICVCISIKHFVCWNSAEY